MYQNSKKKKTDLFGSLRRTFHIITTYIFIHAKETFPQRKIAHGIYIISFYSKIIIIAIHLCTLSGIILGEFFSCDNIGKFKVTRQISAGSFTWLRVVWNMTPLILQTADFPRLYFFNVLLRKKYLFKYKMFLKFASSSNIYIYTRNIVYVYKNKIGTS